MINEYSGFLEYINKVSKDKEVNFIYKVCDYIGNKISYKRLWRSLGRCESNCSSLVFDIAYGDYRDAGHVRAEENRERIGN